MFQFELILNEVEKFQLELVLNEFGLFLFNLKVLV